VAVSQPNKRARALAVERGILEEWIPADLSRPDYMLIRAEFVEKFSQLYLFSHWVTSKRSGKQDSDSPEESKNTAAELKRLDKECMRLAEQLFSRSNLWAVRDWRKPRIVKFLLRAIGRGSGRGRPETPQKKLAELVALRAQGLNDAQIADRLELTKDAVRKRLKAAEDRRS
jgi:hypothetical protein